MCWLIIMSIYCLLIREICWLAKIRIILCWLLIRQCWYYCTCDAVTSVMFTNTASSHISSTCIWTILLLLVHARPYDRCCSDKQSSCIVNIYLFYFLLFISTLTDASNSRSVWHKLAPKYHFSTIHEGFIPYVNALLY